jgi:uncharacterized protein YydD (DUF2326 family)
MNTQNQHLSQFKEVNQKIRVTADMIRHLNNQIKYLNECKETKIKDLKVLLNERKEIKESNHLIKKSKQWNQ